MEKKRSDKKSNNKCKRACKGRVNKNGTYCHHIESQLPKLSRSSVQAIPVGENIDKLDATIEAWAAVKEMPRSQVVAKFKACGLQEHEIQILWMRFWAEMTFQEIVAESGWTSVGSASHCFKETLKKLRRMKFTWK